MGNLHGGGVGVKTLAITLGSALFVLLAIAVWNGTNTPECEALYNEYSATVDMPTREMLFSEGIDNGCFHYN